ncbi:MAG: YCF48-related protein [Ignavibacteria bacterium]
MKKIIIILLIIHCSLIISNAQWIQQNSGTNQNLYDIEFINEKTGWAVGDAGVVIKTTNGGINWINIPNPSPSLSPNLWSVAPIDSNIVYITSGRDLIIKTTNGGMNWDVLNFCPSCNSATIGVHFLNKDTGWFLATNKVFRTYDGGNTLDSFYAPWFTNYEIYFKDINTGIFTGDGRVFKTTNGGEKWFDTYVTNPGSFPMLRKLGIAENRHVWVSGLDAIIHYSSNFCETWSIIDTLNEGIGIVALDFINRDTGYIGGGSNKIFKTTNGGYNWILQKSDTSSLAFIGSIRMVNDNTGWYCGGIGNIFKTTNSGNPTFIFNYNHFEIKDFYLYQNYPNPFNLQTHIEFEVSIQGSYLLEIHNLLGQKLLEVFKKDFKAGKYKIQYNAANLSSGIYIYKLSSENFTVSKKFILLK